MPRPAASRTLAGLEHIAHAPKDRPHADNHPGWGISGDAHHPAPAKKGAKGGGGKGRFGRQTRTS